MNSQRAALPVRATRTQTGLFRRALLTLAARISPRLAGFGLAIPPPPRIFFLLTASSPWKSRYDPLLGKRGIFPSLSEELRSAPFSLALFEKVLREVASFFPEIIFFGPELDPPLLYLEYFKAVRQKGLASLLSTEGFALEESAEPITGILDKIQVRLDGVGEVCDRVKGIPGSFEKILRGLTALDRAKKNQGTSYPRVSISCSILPENRDHLGELAEFLKEAPFSFEGLFLEEPERITEEALAAQADSFEKSFSTPVLFWRGCHDLGAIDRERLKESVRELAASLPFPVGLSLQPQGRRKCRAIFSSPKILPNGEVWICPDYSIGNVSQDSFLKLWNGKRAKLFRRVHLSQPNFPACEGCPGLR